MQPSAVPATGVAGIGCIGGIAKHIIPMFFRDIVPVWGSPWDEPPMLAEAAFAEHPPGGHAAICRFSAIG